MMRFDPRAIRGRLESNYLRRYGSGSAFISQLVDSVNSGDVLLDIGCGEGKLRQKISLGVRYIGLDRYAGTQSNEYESWDMRPNILGDVHQLPVASESCTTVALMHVLEHAHGPGQVFTEISRVLKPGGYLFVDVPFLHEVHHAPYDYFRFTSFSLDWLALTAGFEVIEIRPSGGYFRALSHMLGEAPTVVSSTLKGSLLLRILVGYPLKGLGWLIRKLQYILDLFDEKQTFTCGYHCVFRKRPHESC